MSTIYALATPRGKAGLGVVRISGPDAFAAAGALCGPLPPPRRPALRRLRRPDGDVLDEALVLAFAEGGSYTGEPVVELHCHGSPAILDSVLAALASHTPARPAEPGEFTRRALENGRMDLAQVEGLADLLEAETDLQRTQAWRVFSGGLRAITDAWRTDLLRALALAEASIDFADEEIPEDLLPEIRLCASRVLSGIQAQLDGIGVAERIRDGFEVAIVGPPNVGKSTLINRLAGRPAAITSEVAGTTRDVLEVRLDLHGMPVTILDTAGIRGGADPLETLGIERARQRAHDADLRVILLDAPGRAPIMDPRSGDIVLLGKADLRPGLEGVSGLAGHGVDALMRAVAHELEHRVKASAAFTRHRHREALRRAASALEQAAERRDAEIELLAQWLWDAVRALDSISGRVDIEHVLDGIFKSFCIGK